MKSLVSVVIPTLNAGPAFRETLSMLRRQQLTSALEIIVIDSGSKDETLPMCREMGVAVIPRTGPFNHGETRNEGIRATRGQFVVLTVQDAVPADELWLAHLIKPLERDASLAGSYCRQIARADSHPFTRHFLETSCVGSKVSRTQRLPANGPFAELDPTARMAICTFDNVASCVRRSVWERLPFNSIRFGEDLDWAVRVIQAGWGLAYAADSAVIHSHDRSAWYFFKRTYLTHQLIKTQVGMLCVPSWRAVPRRFRDEVRDRIHILGRLRSLWQWPEIVAMSCANQVGQYMGGRADVWQRRCKPLFRFVDRTLARGV